jgi:hypothetical protein
MKRRVPLGQGQTACKLREMLAAQGYMVELFLFPNGWWRSPQADVMRWEAQVRYAGYCDGRILLQIGSWDTMGNCVRYGFEVTHKGNMSGGVEVHAKQRKA